MMKKLIHLLLVTSVFCGLALAQSGTVTVIHGIPGDSVGLSDNTSLPVDVYVNGNLTFTFDFAESVDNIELPPDTYFVEIYPAGTDADGTDPVLSAEITVEEGENYTAIAHLTYTGDPDAPGITISYFSNDTDQFQPFRGRMGVRHTANAPDVGLSVRRLYLLPITVPGFSNNDGESAESVVLDLVPGQHFFDLLFQGQVVFSTGGVWIQSSQNAIAYAIGDFFTGSFQLFIQEVN